MLVTSTLKTGGDGQPLLIRTTIVDASGRRAYERELLAARREADRERDRLARLASTLQRTLLPPAAATHAPDPIAMLTELNAALRPTRI